MQQVIQQFSETIRKAAAEQTLLRICGSGSKDFYGLVLIGDVLDTRSLTGIIDYEPTELVITARAGTPLRDVEKALADSGQMLAFEPPHFGPDATIRRLHRLRLFRAAPRGDGLRARFRARRANGQRPRRRPAFRRAGHEKCGGL